MQNLRDKLVRAGLASKQEARAARTETRRERKQRGKARAEAEEAAEQQERFEAKQAEQATKAREQQERINREQGEREQRNRVQNLIRAHALLKIGGQDRIFYFVGRDRRIRRLQTTFDIAGQLVMGQLAIVESDDVARRDFELVDAATALRLEELAPERLLFWNKPGATEGDLPAYGAR